MMYPRLKLLHKLLSDDGAIFINIDDNEQASLKMMMDEIFGTGNFVSSIAWQRAYAPFSLNKYFSTNHDFILCYSKNKESFRVNKLPRSEKQNKDYKNFDNDYRGLWKSGNPSVSPALVKNIMRLYVHQGELFYLPREEAGFTLKKNLKPLNKIIEYGLERMVIQYGLRYASLRITNKEERKSYQDNSKYAGFFNADADKSLLLQKQGVEEMSLINVIRLLNPVCIIDESHNAESSLSVDMLKDLNPSFVLDLTATPKDNSNIISIADSMSLKKENMIKLPVVVYNHSRTEDVIDSAITLKKNLEKIAIQNETDGGSYIRPIVLFQAQSKGSEDNVTYQN